METTMKFEAKFEENFPVAPQGVASEVSMACTHSPDAPNGGGVFAFELTTLNWLVSHCVAVLSIPLVDIVAPRLWGWGWNDIGRWSVKRKQLLLAAWRKWAGYKDEENDEAQVQQIWLPSYEQFSDEKPPPNCRRLSPSWLTPSCPLGLRAPTFAA